MGFSNPMAGLYQLLVLRHLTGAVLFFFLLGTADNFLTVLLGRPGERNY